MQDRRAEHRLLCADLVEIEWRDKSGRLRRTMANLEDISHSGACLQLDCAIPIHTQVKIIFTGDLVGIIRYCVYREIGHFLGVRFDEEVDAAELKPQYPFDHGGCDPEVRGQSNPDSGTARRCVPDTVTAAHTIGRDPGFGPVISAEGDTEAAPK
jgi:hypothetical protein